MTSTTNTMNSEDIVLEIKPTEINFDFITNRHDRIMIETAYQAVNQLEMWDCLRKHSDSFMFSFDPRIERIYYKIEELGYYGHSGGSFGETLQNMKYIASYGFEDFKRDYLKHAENK